MRATKNQFLLLLLAVSVFAATAWTTGCNKEDEGTDTGEITDGDDETGDDEGATDDDTPDDPGNDDGDDPVVDEVKFEKDPDVVKIDENELIKRYPPGKKWRGVSGGKITGQASHEDWNIEGTAFFGYTYNVPADITVVSNDRSEIVFDIEFHMISQLLKVSDVEVQLVPPTPETKALLQAVDYQIKEWLKEDQDKLDIYKKIIKGIETIRKLDPGLKKTLTKLFNDQFDLEGDLKAQQARIEELSGKRFRVEYLNGFGVKKITQLDDTKAFTRSQMLKLVNYVSVFLDYHIWPQDTEVGKEYEVDARKIAGVLILDPGADVTGQVSLRRDKDRDPATAVVTVTEGTLTYDTSSSQKESSFNVSTPGGFFLVDKKNYMVTFARIELEASRLVASKDHLLFRAKNAKNIEAEVYYEAKLLTEDGEK
jgi:hypothetical protein